MKTVQCRCGDTITIEGCLRKVYLTPIYRGTIGEVLILDYAQAEEMQAGLAEALKEAAPQAEEPKPEPLEIADFEGDTIMVGLERRSKAHVVEVCTSGEDSEGVWLTEAQTEELIASLEAHKRCIAQENAKPQAEPVSHSPLFCSFDGLPATSFGFTSWLPAPIGYAVAEKLEPKTKTFHITINGDDVTIRKE